jgi:hypothetical protein
MVYLNDADSASLETWVLPKHGMDLLTSGSCHIIKILCLERKYRKAVVAQQTVVEHALKWQADILPVGNLHFLITTNLIPEGRSGAPSATC